MANRLYAVTIKGKGGGTVLVEAASQEAAVREATKKLVGKVWIPTPMEALRLQQDGSTILSPSLTPATPPADGQSQSETGAEIQLQSGSANQTDGSADAEK